MKKAHNYISLRVPFSKLFSNIKYIVPLIIFYETIVQSTEKFLCYTLNIVLYRSSRVPKRDYPFKYETDAQK